MKRVEKMREVSDMCVCEIDCELPPFPVRARRLPPRHDE